MALGSMGFNTGFACKVVMGRVKTVGVYGLRRRYLDRLGVCSREC